MRTTRMLRTRRFRSHAGKPGRYPLAIVAAYGPDTQLATKLVVSVFERPAQPDAAAMRTWHTDGVDARHDSVIAGEISDFLAAHGVKQTVMPDELIGCPHQEGLDYPMGRVCPRCPAWAGLDRFTHQPLAMPVATLTVPEVLDALTSADAPLPEALTSADAQRDALVEPLLAALDRGIADPAGASADDARLFACALYLFAKWREPRAFPHVVRWLSLPEEGPFDIAGDIVTQDGHRILAAVWDGDLEPLTRLARDTTADEFGRGAGVRALALLGAWAEVPMDSVVRQLDWLAREGLERAPSQVWNDLASSVVDIEARSVFDAIRRAYAEDLVDPEFMSLAEVDAAEASPAGEALELTRERYAPIDDIAHALSWWPRGDAGRALGHPDSHEPYRAPPKIGRNEPCPCGSGKKYKRCCGA